MRTLFLLLAIILCSCADSDITSRMQDPVMREEYIKQLKLAKVNFTVRDDEIIIHGETLESLAEKTKPYEKWLAEYDKQIVRRDIENRTKGKSD